MDPVEITLVVLGVSIAASILILAIQLARLAQKLINLINFIEDTAESVTDLIKELKDDYSGIKSKMNFTTLGAIAFTGAVKVGRSIRNLFINEENNE